MADSGSTISLMALVKQLMPHSDLAKTTTAKSVVKFLGGAKDPDDFFSILQEKLGLGFGDIEDAKLTNKVDAYLNRAFKSAPTAKTGEGEVPPPKKGESATLTSRSGRPLNKSQMAAKMAAKSKGAAMPALSPSPERPRLPKVPTSYASPPGTFYQPPPLASTTGVPPVQAMGSTMGVPGAAPQAPSSPGVPSVSPEKAALMNRLLAQSGMSGGRGAPGKYTPPAPTAGPTPLPNTSYGGAEMVVGLPPHLQGQSIESPTAGKWEGLGDVLGTPPGAAAQGAQLGQIEGVQAHLQKVSDLTFQMGERIMKGASDPGVWKAMQKAGAPVAFRELAMSNRSPMELLQVPEALTWIERIAGTKVNLKAPPDQQAAALTQAIQRADAYIGRLEGMPKWWKSASAKGAAALSAALVGIAIAYYMKKRSEKKNEEMQKAQYELQAAGMPHANTLELQALMQLQGMGALGGGMPQQQQAGSATQVTPGTLRISGARGE